MSTTVTYKDNTLTTVNNATKTLKTAGKYMEGDVILTDDSEPFLQSKVATPTTSQQTVAPDTGYDGLSQVTINPIPSQYIIPTGTKSITANGTGIDVTEYAAVDVAVPASSSNDFVVTLSYNDSTEMWEPDCTYAEVRAAYYASKVISVKTNDSSVVADGYYEDTENVFQYNLYNELNYPIEYQQYSYSSSGLNLINDIEVIGKYFDSPSATYTPTESQQTDTITYDPLYYSGIEQVSVTVGAIPSTYVGSGITRRSSTDLTASGATVTAPAGYYASAATKSVASGTEGTPAATKGSVSNHTISVTPSVTNSAGYITGSTKTGTAVSVSASELVSGTYTVSASGTHNVTNYASASVTEGSATAPSSINGTAAAITTGTNTLTLTKTVSITPSVTAGYISTGTEGNSSVSLTASVPTKAAATITPSTSNQTIAAGTYLTGAQTIAGDADLIASNIISTANIFGVQGSVVVQNYYTGTSEPSSSLGINGDLYFQTKE